MQLAHAPYMCPVLYGTMSSLGGAEKTLIPPLKIM